jgi:hypothetical protein
MFPFISSAESDTFTLFGELFISAVYKEIVLATVSSIGCHEAYVGINREKESCQVALENIYTFDGTILISTENIALFSLA